MDETTHNILITVRALEQNFDCSRAISEAAEKRAELRERGYTETQISGMLDELGG